MRVLLALTVVLLTLGAEAKLNPSDFPIVAKIVDVKEGDAGAVSKATKGPFCDNAPADSPLCAGQQTHKVTTVVHNYILTVRAGEKTYELESPTVLDLGDCRAKLHGSYMRLLLTDANGNLKAVNLKILGVHLIAAP